jgi:hypothetical protein
MDLGVDKDANLSKAEQMINNQPAGLFLCVLPLRVASPYRGVVVPLRFVYTVVV